MSGGSGLNLLTPTFALRAWLDTATTFLTLSHFIRTSCALACTRRLMKVTPFKSHQSTPSSVRTTPFLVLSFLQLRSGNRPKEQVCLDIAQGITCFPLGYLYPLTSSPQSSLGDEVMVRQMTISLAVQETLIPHCFCTTVGWEIRGITARSPFGATPTYDQSSIS